MSREVKRVALDFDHPLEKVWPGYQSPTPSRRHRRECPHCQSTGYSPMAKRISDQWWGYRDLDPVDAARANWSADTPALREHVALKIAREPGFYGEGEDAITREATRLSKYFNSQLSRNLSQADADAIVANGRLVGLTVKWLPDERRWEEQVDCKPTAEEVNLWSIEGMGHDSGNMWEVCKARCKREGKIATCSHCHGDGHNWASARVRARFEKFTPVEPPAGPGYQLWETVTEGSPISPVFAKAEELALWLSKNAHGADKGTTAEKWLSFINGPGWAPTAIVSQGVAQTGVNAAA